MIEYIFYLTAVAFGLVLATVIDRFINPNPPELPSMWK